MTIEDIGPAPQAFDLEGATVDNDRYRRVAWSGRYLQVTLMSIPPGGDIGLEAHPDTDQFLRIDAGRGRVQMGPSEQDLSFDREAGDGWCVLVPAGAWHNVTNIGEEPLRLYAVYAPAHHKPGKVHRTQEEAEADGDDEPADWSVQPAETHPDRHA
jgi:mannose-6-phosphate isomerase-like protein (cupin superfamily)